MTESGWAGNDPVSPLRRILVSGPIGSGKSAVAALLAGHGATVIEADRVGHQVLEPDGEAFAAVAAEFPDAVVEGRIDRRRVAAEVFSDPERLRALERLTHPAIGARIAAMIDGVDGVVAVEIPVVHDILGPGWHRIVVLAGEASRRARAIDRGMDPGDADARMASQPGDDAWLAVADSVIHNDGSWADLTDQVARWWAGHVG